MKYILILLLVSCSSVFKRSSVMESDVVIKGGTYHDKKWDEELVFKRVSWFDEVTMAYDFLYAKLNEDNPFRNWLGKERMGVAKCSDFYAVLVYTKRNSIVNRTALIQQFVQKGYEEMVLVDFSHELQAHQGFRDWRLTDHKIMGICAKPQAQKPVEIEMPGFRNVKVFEL